MIARAGTQKTLYTSGDWSVTVEKDVFREPTYTLTVEKSSYVHWSGKVEQSGAVTV